VTAAPGPEAPVADPFSGEPITFGLVDVDPATEPASEAFHDLVPADVRVERISGGHLFTEGPVWDARRGRLLWVDIAGDTIWSWSPEGGRSAAVHPSGKANGLTLDRQGRLVAAGWTSRRVWRLEDDGRATVLATHLDGVPLGTPNDIVVRSDGMIFWTDGRSGVRHAGFETRHDLQIQRRSDVVARWDPRTGKTAVATAEAGRGNGLAFSPDERTLYVNDSAARNLRAFDVTPAGDLINGRVHAERTGSATRVDRSGNIYCTGPGGIHIMDPQGAFLGRIGVPEKGSNLAWGETDWRTLFVTSGRSVYRVRLLARGVPVP
jgi:gluconolactonase